jgi:hypothetical protein
MRKLDVTTPHFTDRVAEAQQLVASRDLTPALADADRELARAGWRRIWPPPWSTPASRPSPSIAAIESEWSELSAQMMAHRDAGPDPSDDSGVLLANRRKSMTEDEEAIDGVGVGLAEIASYERLIERFGGGWPAVPTSPPPTSYVGVKQQREPRGTTASSVWTWDSGEVVREIPTAQLARLQADEQVVG